MTAQPSLVISGVSHAFGAFVAARQVDLSIRPGDVHCLLGPSGSGKSTLLRLVAGLEILQAGKITISGQDVARPDLHVRPEDRSIGLVFQDFALFPHLDVRRNVMFGMNTGSEKARRQASDEWLARVDLTEFASAMPHTLSGGQQQRVALARALARKPEVMLLDESFSSLDARLREDVRRSTLELLREAGVATLLVTHDPSEALLAGDLVSVMQQGQILQTGTPAEVYNHSVSRQVAELFGPVNRLPGQVADGVVESPWGPLPAEGIEPETRVEIIIRPESLELTRPMSARTDARDHSSIHGRIVDLRQGGSLMHLTVEMKGEKPQHGLRLEVQDLARRDWRHGEEVAIRLGTVPKIVRT